MKRVEHTYNDFKTKYKVLKTIPFNSDTKKMTVVVELEPEKKVRVYTKGASENIIDDCAYIYDTKQASGSSSALALGVVMPLDLNKRDSIKEQTLKNMAQKALRTIALGYKDMTFAEYKKAIGEYSIEPTPFKIHEDHTHPLHLIQETGALS